MELITRRQPDDEFETPWAGSLIGAAFFYSIPPALLALAVRNLFRFRELPLSATVASVIWIVFTVWCVWMSISMDGGFQRWSIARLGQIGAKHFVWIDRIEGEPPRISIGFRRFGRRFFYESFPAVDLRKVRWSCGQASAMSRQEMADWSVVVSFHWTEPPNKWWSHDYRGQCGFGFQGEKARIYDFGETLVAFLRRAGIDFSASADGRKYRRIGATGSEGRAGDESP